MKYAIIADIHANLGALKAVARDAAAQECTGITCLGDIVGGYGHPRECISLLQQLKALCVKGNFDEYCGSNMSLNHFNPRTAEMILWTREQLQQEDRKWLNDLKHVDIVSGFTIVHATLSEPPKWQYAFDKYAAAASFEHQTTPVCFMGHIHVPVAFVRDSVVRGGTYSQFKVEPERSYFISVGSVGQPRDGTKRPTYATYDLTTGIIELRRVDYDVSGEDPAAKMVLV